MDLCFHTVFSGLNYRLDLTHTHIHKLDKWKPTAKARDLKASMSAGPAPSQGLRHRLPLLVYSMLDGPACGGLLSVCPPPIVQWPWMAHFPQCSSLWPTFLFTQGTSWSAKSLLPKATVPGIKNIVCVCVLLIYIICLGHAAISPPNFFTGSWINKEIGSKTLGALPCSLYR